MSPNEALLKAEDEMSQESEERQNRFAFPEPNAKHRTIMQQILTLMLDGKRRSKKEIREALGLDPDTEITARLRDLRKPQFGAYCVSDPRSGGPDKDGVYRFQIRIK